MQTAHYVILEELFTLGIKAFELKKREGAQKERNFKVRKLV